MIPVSVSAFASVRHFKFNSSYLRTIHAAPVRLQRTQKEEQEWNGSVHSNVFVSWNMMTGDDSFQWPNWIDKLQNRPIHEHVYVCTQTHTRSLAWEVQNPIITLDSSSMLSPQILNTSFQNFLFCLSCWMVAALHCVYNRHSIIWVARTFCQHQNSKHMCCFLRSSFWGHENTHTHTLQPNDKIGL